jgi:hypothetical protein
MTSEKTSPVNKQKMFLASLRLGVSQRDGRRRLRHLFKHASGMDRHPIGSRRNFRLSKFSKSRKSLTTRNKFAHLLGV